MVGEVISLYNIQASSWVHSAPSPCSVCTLLFPWQQSS